MAGGWVHDIDPVLADVATYISGGMAWASPSVSYRFTNFLGAAVLDWACLGATSGR